MNFIFIINGTAEAGKDSFVLFIREEVCKNTLALLSAIRCVRECKFNTLHNLSTVTVVKEVATILGWKGEKDDKSRKFLSDLKDLWAEYNDGPFVNIVDSISNIKDNEYGDNYIFIHVREPEEIAKFRNYYKDNSCTILIRREGNKVPDNHADMNVENFKYDYVIENNGTLEELKEKAVDFINKFKGVT